MIRRTKDSELNVQRSTFAINRIRKTRDSSTPQQGSEGQGLTDACQAFLKNTLYNLATGELWIVKHIR